MVDNRHGILSHEAMAEFKKLFPNFEIKDKLDQRVYFALTYSYQDIYIHIGGDRGYIEYSLDINNQTINLKEYNEILLQIEIVSINNILLVISAVK